MPQCSIIPYLSGYLPRPSDVPQAANNQAADMELPPEIWSEILNQLYLPELGEMALTCRLFYRIVDERLHRHRLLRKDYDVVYLLPGYDEWDLMPELRKLLYSAEARYYVRHLHICEEQEDSGLTSDGLSPRWTDALEAASHSAADIEPWLPVSGIDWKWSEIPGDFVVDIIVMTVMLLPTLRTLSLSYDNGIWKQVSDELKKLSLRILHDIQRNPHKAQSSRPLHHLQSVRYCTFERPYISDFGMAIVSLPSVRNVHFDTRNHLIHPAPDEAFKSRASTVEVWNTFPPGRAMRRLATWFEGPCTITFMPSACGFHSSIRRICRSERTLRIPWAGASPAQQTLTGFDYPCDFADDYDEHDEKDDDEKDEDEYYEECEGSDTDTEDDEDDEESDTDTEDDEDDEDDPSGKGDQGDEDDEDGTDSEDGEVDEDGDSSGDDAQVRIPA